MSDIEREAKRLINTSVDDAISSAPHHSIHAIERAIQMEQSRKVPRVSLIRGLRTELRKKERAAAAAPKDAA